MKATPTKYVKFQQHGRPDEERALVRDRILALYNTYGEDFIIDISTKAKFKPKLKAWRVKATVKLFFREPDKVQFPPYCTEGTAIRTLGTEDEFQMSALEWAETSAVGRALAFMGIGIDFGVASADEIKSVTRPFLEELQLRFKRKKAQKGLTTTDSKDKAVMASKLLEKVREKLGHDRIKVGVEEYVTALNEAADELALQAAEKSVSKDS